MIYVSLLREQICFILDTEFRSSIRLENDQVVQSYKAAKALGAEW